MLNLKLKIHFIFHLWASVGQTLSEKRSKYEASPPLVYQLIFRGYLKI